MFKSNTQALTERYEGTSHAVTVNSVASPVIQGWLLLLMVNLLFGALVNLLGTFTSPDTFTRVVCFIAAVTAGVASYLMIKHDRRGVNWAKWHFGILVLFYALAVYGSQTAHGFDDNAMKYVSYLLKAMVWFTYLFVSKRVKAVYYPASL